MLREQIENKTVFIVTKEENVLYAPGDQRTLYYLPRKVNDNVDFAVFNDYNDAYKYVVDEKLDKYFIIESQII